MVAPSATFDPLRWRNSSFLWRGYRWVPGGLGSGAGDRMSPKDKIEAGTSP